MNSGRSVSRFFGILNVTPDSFSDGGQYFALEQAVAKARSLIDEGADFIDIGGDSTRSGSLCTGPEEELKRILPVVKSVSKLATVSVDTHHAFVAEKAIENGAEIINDISSGSDPEMFNLVQQSGKKIILTYTRCPKPHDFSLQFKGDIIENIKCHFDKVLNKAIISGVKKEQIIIDTGMGAFISEKEDTSWELLARLSELKNLDYPFMLSISRKGFLKTGNEKKIPERDLISAYLSYLCMKISDIDLAYYRVHDVKLHKQLLTQLNIEI